MVQWLMSKLLDTATQVQILDEIIDISHSSRNLWKI